MTPTTGGERERTPLTYYGGKQGLALAQHHARSAFPPGFSTPPTGSSMKPDVEQVERWLYAGPPHYELTALGAHDDPADGTELVPAAALDKALDALRESIRLIDHADPEIDEAALLELVRDELTAALRPDPLSTLTTNERNP